MAASTVDEINIDILQTKGSGYGINFDFPPVALKLDGLQTKGGEYGIKLEFPPVTLRLTPRHA